MREGEEEDTLGCVVDLLHHLVACCEKQGTRLEGPLVCSNSAVFVFNNAREQLFAVY